MNRFFGIGLIHLPRHCRGSKRFLPREQDTASRACGERLLVDLWLTEGKAR